MEVIRSNKGSEKLCYNGYAYTKKHTTKSTIRWECCKRGSIKCTGAVITDLSITTMKSQKDHTHPADHFEVAAMKVKADIKGSVQSQHTTPSSIIDEKMLQYPVQVRAACGDKENLKRTVRRVKRANVPKEPASIQDIPYPLPDEYRKNGGTENSDFLIYDNGSETERMLVFRSDIGLSILADSESWFMDGTYDTAPSQFSQLYVIRASISETYVTSVYAFLPSKQQSVYEELLSVILDSCLLRNLRPNPTRVVVDFEMAIHNAIKSVLGENIEIQGCFYHLTQTTWRRVQSEGLQAAYLSDEEVRHFCGKIDGLAFLPVTDVSDGIKHLRETAPDCLNSIVDYFDSTYVSGGFKSVRGENGSLRFRRTPPRFPPHTWNVHEATLNDQSRTNNVCEGWNNAFKTLVGHSNPSLWYVINCLQKDNCDVETVYEQNLQGLPSKRRKNKKNMKQQMRLKRLCCQFVSKEKSLTEFMEAIGNCIRLH